MRNWGTVVTGFYILIAAALSPGFGLIVLAQADLSFDPSRVIDWLRIASWSGWTLFLPAVRLS